MSVSLNKGCSFFEPHQVSKSILTVLIISAYVEFRIVIDFHKNDNASSEQFNSVPCRLN